MSDTQLSPAVEVVPERDESIVHLVCCEHHGMPIAFCGSFVVEHAGPGDRNECVVCIDVADRIERDGQPLCPYTDQLCPPSRKPLP